MGGGSVGSSRPHHAHPTSHARPAAEPPRPPAPPAPAAPVTVDSFHAERARTEHLARPMMSGDPAAQGAARALAAHEAERNTTYSLTDRTQVGMLISRSPQLDGLDGTQSDQNRCGGAAVFNAMLLAGNPAANAEALRRLAQHQMGAPDIPTAALDAMANGHLTAAQASQLQDLTYQLGFGYRTDDAVGSAEGLNARAVRGLVDDLRARGAFAGAGSVVLNNHVLPNGTPHWTAHVTTPTGSMTADSWPRSDGYATAVTGDYRPPGAPAGAAAYVSFSSGQATSTAYDRADSTL